MKLKEILKTATASEPVGSTLRGMIEQFKDKLKPIRNITSKLELHRAQNTFALVKEGEVVGWVSFKDKVQELHDTKYYVLDFIYLTPALRKSAAGGAFLIALNQELDHPIIIGTESDYGGVLFKDGAKLVDAMSTSANFDVSVFDFKTGKTRSYVPGEELQTGVTLVIEQQTLPFPFFHESAAMYIYEGCEEREAL